MKMLKYLMATLVFVAFGAQGAATSTDLTCDDLRKRLEPTPEALARLQAAVQSAPARKSPAAVVPTTQSAGKPRFGINSLINRMTGHQSEIPSDRTVNPDQEKPPVNAADEQAESDTEHERIEIPAFLRRQAN